MEREEVIKSTKHFRKLEDKQLLRIIDGIPPDGGNYNGLERHEAEVELHRRKGRSDNWMLAMTAAILILTLYLAYKEFTQREPSHFSNPAVNQVVADPAYNKSRQNEPTPQKVMH